MAKLEPILTVNVLFGMDGSDISIEFNPSHAWNRSVSPKRLEELEDKLSNDIHLACSRMLVEG